MPSEPEGLGVPDDFAPVVIEWVDRKVGAPPKKTGDEVILTFPNGVKLVALMTFSDEEKSVDADGGSYVPVRFERVARDREVVVLMQDAARRRRN